MRKTQNIRERDVIQDSAVARITHTLPTMMELPINPHYENWTQLGFADSPDIGTLQALKGHKQFLPSGCFKHSSLWASGTDRCEDFENPA